MFRCPLPSSGSLQVGSPPSSVLWGTLISRRPSRRTSLPSLGGTAFVPVVRSRRVRARSPAGLDVLISRSPSRHFTRRRLDLPGSCGIPGVGLPRSLTPAELLAPGLFGAGVLSPHSHNNDDLSDKCLSGLTHAAFPLAVYASQQPLPDNHARLASGWWPAFAGQDSDPQGSLQKVSGLCGLVVYVIRPPSPGFTWRTMSDTSFGRGGVYSNHRRDRRPGLVR